MRFSELIPAMVLTSGSCGGGKGDKCDGKGGKSASDRGKNPPGGGYGKGGNPKPGGKCDPKKPCKY